MAKNEQRIYRLFNDRLRRSLINGFSIEENDTLLSDEDTMSSNCILAHIDSNILDCPWGRFAMNTAIDGELVITIRAFASNERVFSSQRGLVDIDEFLMDENIPLKTKSSFFTAANAVQSSGHNDILLYGQSGRFIWLWIEANGSGRCEISNMKLFAPGDTFLNTFPEVYRSDADFLHRFLSIFSTMHYDMEQMIDSLPRFTDIDTAPNEALPVFASWIGLQFEDGFLTDDELRLLLKNAYRLFRVKGTRLAIESIVKLFVPQQFYIVERNLLSKEQQKGADTLYGSTPFDFSILINAHADNDLSAKLQMLIDMFKPIRSRANIIFLQDCDSLDGFTYLDVNGVIGENSEGSLDGGYAINGTTYLG